MIERVTPLDLSLVTTLLGRAPVVPDSTVITRLVHGRSVLVTGAGGSIGSELCRQIWQHIPSSLVMLDRAEDNLFRVHLDIPSGVACIGDVCDRARVEVIFARHRPNVVVHAAAYKHVPMMEDNALEALRNNVLGTRTIADAAALFGAHAFVLVSTDKAVAPTSVMGATKRLAELYCGAMHARTATRFMVVRFGNVLGSTGSVVPVFLEQIARGGPITITHPKMVRYFMTIPEACGLVLQAAATGDGGELFVLDMGAPIKILDLAHALVSHVGKRCPEDVEIAFTGVRPGEKLREELSREGLSQTAHPGILVCRPLPQHIEDVVETFHRVAAAENVRASLLKAACEP